MARRSAPDCAIEPFAEGYVDGVRDAASWNVQAFARLHLAAVRNREEAQRLEREAKDALEAAQRRWAEECGLRGPVADEAFERQRAAGRARAKGRARRSRAASQVPTPAAEPGPTLNLDARVVEAPERDLTDAQQERRAAARRWTA